MRITFISLAALLTATLAFAELDRYSDWADGPVRHLMTAEERAQWQTLQTDDQAKDFIALFWARRDPTPATPANEFRDEFDKRVNLADEHFITKRTRGALTDRGRTMILLGSPFNVGNRGPASDAPGNPNFENTAQWDGLVRGPRGASAMMTWTYAQDKKPDFIKRKDFAVVFVDDQGDGQWQIATGGRLNPESIFGEAVRAFIFNPDLKTAPAFDLPAPDRLGMLKTDALDRAYTAFRAGNEPAMGPALLMWGQYVTPDGESFVPVQLFLPSGAGFEAGRQLTFFGVVENVAQEIVTSFEENVTLAGSLRDAYVDKSLLLKPGTYKTTVGLADKDRVIAMSTVDMTVEPLDPKESAISQLILSNHAFALPEAQLITDPFAFGGLKVVPKADALFSRNDDIWYFFELRNPGVADGGMPKIQAKIDIEGKDAQDKTIRKTLPWQEIETLPLKGVKDHYGLGMSFPLKDFAPGRYTVKIRVLDTVLKKTYQAEKDFRISS